MILPIRFFVFLLVTVNALGCIREPLSRGKVITGKVMLDGKTLAGGTVEFESADGRYNSTSDIKLDGSYVIQEPPIGICKVAVRTSYLKSFVPPISLKGKVPKSQYPSFSEEEQGYYTAIPLRYESTSTSKLEVDIKGSGEIPAFDIEMLSK
jgi:hypothetical protein